MTRRERSRPPRPPRLPPPTRDQIAALAYAIWQDRGCPEGSDVDIWLEAERQLKGDVPHKVAADDIPANPDAAGDPDEDPALRPDIDRQLDTMTPRPEQRSPTSL